MQRPFDPILVEVIKNEIAAVTEEMTLTVYRTGRSGMCKVGDFATAVCDRQAGSSERAAHLTRCASLSTR